MLLLWRLQRVFLFLRQVEQAVSDLQRGGAVWDGKRVLAEETLLLGKVRGDNHPYFDRWLFQTKSKRVNSFVVRKMSPMILIFVRIHHDLGLSFCVTQTDGELVFSHHPDRLLLRLLCLPQ